MHDHDHGKGVVHQSNFGLQYALSLKTYLATKNKKRLMMINRLNS
jgi:hypothetical protein